MSVWSKYNIENCVDSIKKSKIDPKQGLIKSDLESESDYCLTPIRQILMFKLGWLGIQIAEDKTIRFGRANGLSLIGSCRPRYQSLVEE